MRDFSIICWTWNAAIARRTLDSLIRSHVCRSLSAKASHRLASSFVHRFSGLGDLSVDVPDVSTEFNCPINAVELLARFRIGDDDGQVQVAVLVDSSGNGRTKDHNPGYVEVFCAFDDRCYCFPRGHSTSDALRVRAVQRVSPIGEPMRQMAHGLSVDVNRRTRRRLEHVDHTSRLEESDAHDVQITDCH